MKTVVLTDSGLKVYDQKMKTYMDEKDALLETEIDNLTEIVNNNTNRIDTINLTNIVDNLLTYPYCQTSRTASGMTFTVNEDGTIHAKGKSTAATNQGIRTRTTGDKNPMILPPGTYTIHGCPKGGSLTSYYFQVGCTRNDTFFSLGNDYGEGTTFTLTEETQIQILIIIAAECPEIDLVFKPMCEVGTVIHEYQPYVLSRHYLVDNTCVHNLIPYPYYNASSDIGGIDWVDNGDGTIAASGTENHSTNTNSTFWLASVYNPIFLEAGTYTFTGCPEGASAETWYVRFGDENNNFLASDIGEGCYFTLETDQYVTASLRVVDNVTIPDKIIFKPMLVKGSVPREYKQYKDVEDQIVADNLIESNIDTTGFIRCTTKAYNNGTCILTADGTSGNPYHYRDYVLEQGKVYTFSTKGNSADAKGWYMSAMYLFDTSPVTYETLKPSTIYTNNYKTQSMTFAVNKECRAVRITVGIANGSATAGTKATFTEMMLEEGAVAHKYQLPKANKGYNRVDITNHSLDLNTLNLELGSPDIMQYKCRTSGGSANITNIPVASSPFNLDVEVVRWASKTDYVTRQVFVVVSKPNFEYVRWCTSGTWSEWVERKFTDTTYSNMTAATANAAGKAGLVPAPAKGNQAKFLRGDGTWQTPTNTTYSNFVKSGSGAKAGLVPAPSTTAGTTKYLREDGTWQVPPDTNTTYTNASLGQGYGTCVTGSTTAAKVVTLSGYTLVLGGIVAVKFSYAITGESTMNINSKGAKPIYYRGAAITDGIINAGDIATFMYNGSQYHLISIDKGILNNTTKGSLGFNSSTAQNLVPTVSTIAFWDGAYTNTTSNLAYCKLGAFGDAAVKGVDTTPTNGSVNLVTSGGVYDELNKPNYGTCSTAAATVEKAVTCTGWELKTGAEITVKFTVTNTANNPTLNVNSTGAKPIYYRGSAITAGYLAANRTYTFRYNGTQYEFVGDLDSNSFDRIRYNGNIKCSATAIVAGNIIVGSNGTFQHLKLGKPFDITYPILYAASAIAASGTGSNNYKAIAATITTTQSITLTAYKPVYIKGKLNGTYFTPVSKKPLTQTIPTTEDGYQYILLGLAYATNGLYLYPENPIYEYTNGSFRLYGDLSSNDIVNDLSTAVAVTNTETPVGCGVAKELNQKMLQIVSFDLSTGTLVTKSYDYTG